MAKYEALKADIFRWVELNGLHPQPCGAAIGDLCAAMGIDAETYRRWMQKAEFAEGIKNANATFAASTEIEVVNALKRAATGFVYEKKTAIAGPKVIKTYDKNTGKKIREEETDEIVRKKVVKEDLQATPQVAAAIFLLTNLAPDRWKNRQNTDITSGDKSLADTFNARISPREAAKMIEDLTKDGKA